MTGAKLQLYSVGKENSYLTQNPQISFFKQVYMKYSNFAMQSIDLQFDFMGEISYDKTTKIKLKLDKNGDLINTMFLELNIPPINHYNDNKHYKIHWANNLGNIIVKNARVIIGGNVVEEYDSEFMYIYNNLSNTPDKRNKENDLLSKEDLNYAINLSQSKQSMDTVTYLETCENNIPDIKGKNIRVPLPFWFHRNIGASLPISNLLYHDAIVEIEIRPLKELLNYYDTSEITVGAGVTHAIPINQIKSISIPDNQGNVISHEKILSYFINNSININPILNVDYIFLDKQMRTNFHTNTLQYIVEPVTKLELFNKTGKIDIRDEPTDSMPHHPCKEIYIAPRRNDVVNTNNWLKFTNDDNHIKNHNREKHQTYFYEIARSKYDADAPNYSNYMSPIHYLYNFTDSANTHLIGETSYTIDDNEKLHIADINELLTHWLYRDYKHIPSINNDNYTFFTPDIINNISIDFDETNRLAKKDFTYFNKIQPFLHHNNNIEGVCSYSFSLNPDKYQPSGSCNLSKIKNIRFEIDLKNISNELSKTEKYKYDVNIYMKYYNVLQIKSGMAELLFKI